MATLEEQVRTAEQVANAHLAPRAVEAERDARAAHQRSPTTGLLPTGRFLLGLPLLGE